MKLKRLIVFDLDGTLLYTIKGISHALNLALKSVGLEGFSDEETMLMVGKSSRFLVHEALRRRGKEDMSEKREEALLNHYNQIYFENASYETIPYPGIKDVIKARKEAGDLLAVYSNKPDNIVKKVLKDFFDPYDFDVVRGFREDTKRKPDPEGLFAIIDELGIEKEMVTYVGDSRVDGELAMNAGVDAVLVSYGYCKKTDLSDFNYEIAHDCRDLGLLLERRETKLS